MYSIVIARYLKNICIDRNFQRICVAYPPYPNLHFTKLISNIIDICFVAGGLNDSKHVGYIRRRNIYLYVALMYFIIDRSIETMKISPLSLITYTCTPHRIQPSKNVNYVFDVFRMAKFDLLKKKGSQTIRIFM